MRWLTWLTHMSRSRDGKLDRRLRLILWRYSQGKGGPKCSNSSIAMCRTISCTALPHMYRMRKGNKSEESDWGAWSLGYPLGSRTSDNGGVRLARLAMVAEGWPDSLKRL